jgi:peptidoglycan/xylan/chitin deacetylase (PgdA/CDA1 family)
VKVTEFMKLPLLQNIIARTSRGFVLAFHDIEAQPMEHFLDALYPIQPVHLSDLVHRTKTGKSTAGLCAITVDDGVGRTVATTTELCRRRKWPVTFFLPTGNLDTGEGIAYQWWRQVLPLIPARRLELPSGTFDFSQPNLLQDLSTKFERLWHSAPLEVYRPFTMELVEAVAREAGVPIEHLLPSPPVSWEAVSELSKDDLFRFESHGISHVAMSALSDDVLALELKHSRDTISEHTGRLCRHLAYPFGSSMSIGTLAPVMAQTFYDSAVTMALGHVDAANPWLLPRLPLYSENSTFVARLKIALKCSRLAGFRARHEIASDTASRAEQYVSPSR